MNKFILLAIIFSLSSLANAECFGGDTYKTCYDNNGNTYDITKYGNTTEVSGYNSRTGSRWSQESTNYGNITEVTGTDKDGNRWNETITDYGNSINYEGNDSDGNRFQKTCWKQYDGTLNCQ